MTKFKLEYPVTWDGQEISEIEIRRPKGKDIKYLKGDKLGDIMDLASRITDYTDKFFDELDAADYVALSDVLSDFLERGQPTGS